MQGTLQKIDIKAIKRRILATSPPTDTLHRATLINSALVPLYNHVFMALPTAEADLDPLHREILGFLWTRTTDSVTTQKRRLVAAKRRVADTISQGNFCGPQIESHPKMLQENRCRERNHVHKNNRRDAQTKRTPQSNYTHRLTGPNRMGENR